MIEIHDVARLQDELVAAWHLRPIDNPYSGLLHTVCEQHRWNFMLWHEEDVARSPLVSDSEIAAVKRRIDQYNQNRNNWIEAIDDAVTQLLLSQSISTRQDARLNTETIGSAIDRLSIQSLRIYHLEEQRDRGDANGELRKTVAAKLATCRSQRSTLVLAATQLMRGICRGEIAHQTFRQHKMYNDPSLNPFLYDAERSARGLQSSRRSA